MESAFIIGLDALPFFVDVLTMALVSSKKDTSSHASNASDVTLETWIETP